ncbi:peptide ABC transporter substrate-binding protein SapA [Vibrio sp. DNF-1]|nr:peptide ABC transporter substrate-binding protein SapA [Vibrio salinus]
MVTLSACKDNVDHNNIRKTGFVYCAQGNSTTFNPQLAESGLIVSALGPQIYDTLLVLNDNNQKPRPNIAESWTVSDNGTHYVFKLRKNVHFQNTAWFTPSRTLNARDVVFSFDRIINPENPFHFVNGGHYPWFDGINFVQLVKSVKMLDDYTVEFILSKPDNSFLSNIATPHAVILSEEYADQLILEDEKGMLDNFPVGTGPFYVDEFHSDDFIRLRRNNNYWNGVAKMAQVVFDISQRGTGTLAKLLLNECDVLSTPISSQIPIIEQRPNIGLLSAPAMNVSYIAINTEHPAIKDRRVRKAISMAINRNNILDSVYYGTGSIAYTMLPPSSWAYQKDTFNVRYDKNYALGLLKDAGFDSGLELTMLVPLKPSSYNPSPRKTAELIQSDLKNVGITLHLISEKRVSKEELNSVDLIITGWSGKTADPDSFLRPILSCSAVKNGRNLSKWCNPDFDFLLDLATEVNRPRYRLNIYRQAQYVINDEVPVIPLAHGMQFKAYNKTLKGFKINPFNVEPFNHVERVQ